MWCVDKNSKGYYIYNDTHGGRVSKRHIKNNFASFEEFEIAVNDANTSINNWRFKTQNKKKYKLKLYNCNQCINIQVEELPNHEFIRKIKNIFINQTSNITIVNNINDINEWIISAK